jgi:hypothetical protein
MSLRKVGDVGAGGRLARVGLSGALLALAVTARLLWLHSLPGVNGDEAWYGVWVEGALRDRVWGGATPTGNFPNPFFLAPLGIVQAIADPAPWVLRVPAVLSGLGFILVGYAGLRAAFGRSSATVFVLLAATAPTAIAYSRFGWDASETPLAVMLFLWCCFSRNWLWAAGALAAAFIVHPANIFLVPIFAAFLAEDLTPWLARRAGQPAARHLLGLVMIGGTLAALAASLMLGSVTPGELVSADYWRRIATLFSDLFSGVTVYTYIVGPPGGLVLHRVVAAVVLVTALGLLLFDRRSPRDRRATVLLAGLAVSVVAFAVIVGPAGLSPHRERYALLFVAPVLVLVAVALTRAFGERSAAGPCCAAILGCLALAGVWMNYLAPLRLTGGQSHATFRTAAVEPKWQAALWIREHAAQCNSTMVWAESWWLAEPLRYFLFYRPAIEVRQVDDGAMPPTGGCQTLGVVFAGSPWDERLSRGAPRPEAVIQDATGRPFILIYRVESAPDGGATTPGRTP